MKIILRILLISYVLISCSSNKSNLVGGYYANLHSDLERYLLELREDSMYILNFCEFLEIGVWSQDNNIINLTPEFTTYNTFEELPSYGFIKSKMVYSKGNLIGYSKTNTNSFLFIKNDKVKKYINPEKSKKVAEIDKDHIKGKQIYYKMKNKYDEVRSRNCTNQYIEEGTYYYGPSAIFEPIYINKDGTYTTYHGNMGLLVKNGNKYYMYDIYRKYGDKEPEALDTIKVSLRHYKTKDFLRYIIYDNKQLYINSLNSKKRLIKVADEKLF